MLLKGGGSEQHKGPQSLFVEGLLEGGGVRTTDGVTVFVCRNKKKQRKGIADWLFQGGGGRTTQGATVFVCTIG